MKRLGDLYRLLRPHAAPYVLTLLAVVALGTTSALLQKGTFLLLTPTWQVLFPKENEKEKEEEAESASNPEEIEVPVDAEELGAVTEPVEGADTEGADESGLPSSPVEDNATEEEEEPGLLSRITQRLEGWKDSMTVAITGDPETLHVPGEAGDRQRMHALYRIGGIVTVMALLAGISHYLMGVLSGFVGLKMMVSLRMSLARHLMGLSMRYHTGRRFGDLLSRISSDVGNTTQVVQLVLKDLVQEPLQLVVSLSLALFIAPIPTLFVLLGLPLFIAPIAILLKRVRKSSHKSASQLGSTFQVLTQMFQGIRTVKAYRAEERELDRFQVTNDLFVDETMKMIRPSALSRAWTIFFTNFGIAAVVVFVGMMVVRGGAFDGGGDMMVFFLMISQASSHLKRTTRVIAQVSEAQGPAVRLLDLMGEQADVVEKVDAHPLTGLGEGIRFENVGFEYPDDEDPPAPDAPRFALSGIDLHVRPGETLALVGPSGSGKSTLLDLVARFVDPTSGRVTFGGHDLRDLSFDSLTSRYALVTQSPFLFHASISENIRYGKPDATQAEVEAAARAANIHEFILELSDGYETNVKDAGTRLSGGQRQRITIARALLRDPELLLLDEATSALDTESEAVVQAALEEMMVGRTTIVIAHRLSTIRGADRIAVLDKGRVVEVGSHEELLTAGGLYARLNAAQG